MAGDFPQSIIDQIDLSVSFDNKSLLIDVKKKKFKPKTFHGLNLIDGSCALPGSFFFFFYLFIRARKMDGIDFDKYRE